MSERYTYGDGDLAARRLDLVAAMFEPSTTSFLQAVVASPPRLAVDLGCGPGSTTLLVHRVIGAGRTVGIERSRSFLSIARSRAVEGTTFVEHDVRSVPFPVEPAGVITSRLLLAHLAAPEDVVARWSTQLAPGGILLLEEPQSIEDGDPAFVAYLAEVASVVLRGQGADLYVGKRLHAMEDPPGTERAEDRVVTFTPEASRTAAIFAMNLRVLEADGEIEPRPDLAGRLESIAGGSPAVAPTWRVRQVAFAATIGA